MSGNNRKRRERQLERLAQSACSLVDAGRTPPWHPAPPYQQESALRSTLSADYEDGKRKDSVVDLENTPLDVFSRPRCNRSRADASETADGDALPASDYPAITFTPINNRQPAPYIIPTDSDLFTQRYNRSIPQLNIDMYDVKQHQLASVDREDGRVYHFGHFAGGTYSGTFVEERALPLETLAFIDKKLGEQSTALRIAEGPRREREVRALLETGSSLMLHKTADEVDASDENAPVCALQGCLSRADRIPPATYWFAFQKMCALGPHLEEDFCFCLKCLEWLWQGKDYTNNLAQPGVVPRSETGIAPASMYVIPSLQGDTSSEDGAFSLDGGVYSTPICATFTSVRDDHLNRGLAIPQLDGLDDWPPTPTADHGHLSPSPFSGYGSPVQEFGETPPHTAPHVEGTEQWRSLCASRHADPAETVSEKPASTDMEDECVSPHSVNSDGEWIYPPTRLQHIAAFVKPGIGLSVRDKAAVWLWKAASREQLRWEAHLRKTRSIRAYYAGLSIDIIGIELEEFRIEDDDDDEEESVEYWAGLTGLQKNDCHGHDLSEILYKVGKIGAA